jgi:hypothetical protein
MLSGDQFSNLSHNGSDRATQTKHLPGPDALAFTCRV